MTDAGSGDFDGKQFMASLARSHAEHQLVTAQRPGADEVAELLKGFGSIFYEWVENSRRIACLESGDDPDETNAWFPRPGSLASRDAAALNAAVHAFCSAEQRSSHHWLETNPLRNPAIWGTDFLTRCTRTAIETITAIGSLAETGSHLRAPLILARSSLEATATACFLVDSDVDQRERTRRVLNVHLAQVKESLLETVACGLDPEGDELELIELMLFADHLGYKVSNYKPSGWKPPVIPGTGSVNESMSTVIDLVLPRVGRSIWRSLSAVSHSREAHTLIPDEHALPHELLDWQRTEVVALHTLPAVLTLGELCTRLTRYIGWEFAEFKELLDVIARQLATAAGMADDQIRSAMGLDPIA